MKNGKKCWKMKSIAGIILTCIFLTACGEETKELMTGNDELKILEEVERTADRDGCVPDWQGDFTKYLFSGGIYRRCCRLWALRDCLESDADSIAQTARWK